MPPIDLLSVDLVELASPNPVVGNKTRDIYRDLALHKGKELIETRSPSTVSYVEAVKSSRIATGASYSGKFWRFAAINRVNIVGCISQRDILNCAE